MLVWWLCALSTTTLPVLHARAEVTVQQRPRQQPTDTEALPATDTTPVATTTGAPQTTASAEIQFSRQSWNLTLDAVNGSLVCNGSNGQWDVADGQRVWNPYDDSASSEFSFDYVGSSFCIEGTFPADQPTVFQFAPPDPADIARVRIASSPWCVEQQFGHHSVSVWNMLAVRNVVVTTGMGVPVGLTTTEIATRDEPFVVQDQEGKSLNPAFTYTNNQYGNPPPLVTVDDIDNIFVWNQSVSITVPANSTYMIVWGSLSNSSNSGMTISLTPDLNLDLNTSPPWADSVDSSMNHDSFIRAMLPLDSRENYTITLTSPVYPGGSTERNNGFSLSKVTYYTIPPKALAQVSATLTSSATPTSTATTTSDETTSSDISNVSLQADSNTNHTVSRIWKGILAGIVLAGVLVLLVAALLLFLVISRARDRHESKESFYVQYPNSANEISAPFQISNRLRNDSGAEPLLPLQPESRDDFGSNPDLFPLPPTGGSSYPPYPMHSTPQFSRSDVDHSAGGQQQQPQRAGHAAHDASAVVFEEQGSPDSVAYDSSSLGVNSWVSPASGGAGGGRNDRSVDSERPTTPTFITFPLPPWTPPEAGTASHTPARPGQRHPRGPREPRQFEGVETMYERRQADMRDRAGDRDRQRDRYGDLGLTVPREREREAERQGRQERLNREGSQGRSRERGHGHRRQRERGGEPPPLPQGVGRGSALQQQYRDTRQPQELEREREPQVIQPLNLYPPKPGRVRVRYDQIGQGSAPSAAPAAAAPTRSRPRIHFRDEIDTPTPIRRLYPPRQPPADVPTDEPGPTLRTHPEWRMGIMREYEQELPPQTQTQSQPQPQAQPQQQQTHQHQHQHRRQHSRQYQHQHQHQHRQDREHRG